MEDLNASSEKLLAEGRRLAAQIENSIEAGDQVQPDIIEAIFRRKIRRLETLLRESTRDFLDYERSVSDLFSQIAALPKFIVGQSESPAVAGLIVSQISAQRDTLRKLLDTLTGNNTDLRQRAESRLSIFVNLSLLLLTIASIAIALASYRTAVETFKDAKVASIQQQGSTERQIAVLDKSREALQAVANAIPEQEKLLGDAARSAQVQVQLLRQQQARELEQADVAAVIYYPKAPSILIVNNGPRRVANDVFYEVRLRNLSVSKDGMFGVLGTAAPKIDYILPHRSVGPNSLHFYPSAVERTPEQGERLFGYATVMCPVCKKTRVYWIYIVYGQDGVFAEGKGGADYSFLKIDAQNVSATVDQFLQRKDLVRMPSQLQ
jgi:hypothetical protein